MASSSSSRPIPDGWREEEETMMDGSVIKVYTCPETTQKFRSYERLLQYVEYAKREKISIYTVDEPPKSTSVSTDPGKRKATVSPDEDQNADRLGLVVVHQQSVAVPRRGTWHGSKVVQKVVQALNEREIVQGLPAYDRSYRGPGYRLKDPRLQGVSMGRQLKPPLQPVE